MVGVSGVSSTSSGAWEAGSCSGAACTSAASVFAA
jgi:hypothetical protein